jgi:hypothetical protein
MAGPSRNQQATLVWNAGRPMDAAEARQDFDGAEALHDGDQRGKNQSWVSPLAARLKRSRLGLVENWTGRELDS